MKVIRNNLRWQSAFSRTDRLQLYNPIQSQYSCFLYRLNRQGSVYANPYCIADGAITVGGTQNEVETHGSPPNWLWNVPIVFIRCRFAAIPCQILRNISFDTTDICHGQITVLFWNSCYQLQLNPFLSDRVQLANPVALPESRYNVSISIDIHKYTKFPSNTVIHLFCYKATCFGPLYNRYQAVK
jgi:hypothetical protein